MFLLDSTSEFWWKTNHLAWKKFEDYRVETIVRLHEEFLKMIEEVRAVQPQLRVIVTAMDNLGSPELRQNFGVDVQRIIELQIYSPRQNVKRGHGNTKHDKNQRPNKSVPDE